MAGLPVRGIKTVVESVEDGGHGVKVYTLCDPDLWELPPFRPGAHIDMHLPGGLVRTYSLCNDPVDDKHYVIAVKREANGRGGSIAFHDEVKAGDTLIVSLPRGGLRLDDAPHVTFVAGGIGVTPFLSAAGYLARRGRDFTLHVIARGEPPLATILAPHRASGHAIIHDTVTSIRPALEALIDTTPPDAMLACCGPLDMLDAFERATRSWPTERVHLERFVPPPLLVDPQARPFRLVLARSHREIEVSLGVSILEALLGAGIDIPASCCGGICGACRIDWLEGTPVHRDRVLSTTERARSLMACVSGSAEERLVVDL
ncbi:MAG TPA: PDR/VanB family oxidoreductase [Bradyrhizobium sp.]|nr:PDR/VanB family oxidoreductase [Bradyrhizobium sp.]